MKIITLIGILFFASAANAQTIAVDSLRRSVDSLGNIFFQRYTEIAYDEGGRQTILTNPVDSANFVDSLMVGIYNRYLPATHAKRIVLNIAEYNRGRNQGNALAMQAGTSYWDFTDRLLGNQFAGLWRVSDTQSSANDFYEARIAGGRLVFRRVDATFTRDSLGQLQWFGGFSPGSANTRALIQNIHEFRINWSGAPIEVLFDREAENDDRVGQKRAVWWDTARRYRFVFLRDIVKASN